MAMSVKDFFDGLNSGATWAAGVAFQRSNPLPLDKYSVFNSKEEAETYASTNAVAYPGQIVAVITETDSAIYYINETMTLEEVGGVLTADEKSVVINTDAEGNKTLSLKDFGVQYYKYIPAVEANPEEGVEAQEAGYELVTGWIAGLEPKVRLKDDNSYEIAWYEPNPTTVEGLSSQISSLNETVGSLQDIINNAKGEKESLKERIDAVETGAKIEVSTETTTEGAAKSYTFKQGDTSIVTIDIPKDMVVSSGTIEVYTEDNKPEGVATAGTYVVLTIANATSDKLYINVSTLLDDKTVEGSEGEMITVSTDTSEGPVKISASIVDGSITEGKLATEITEKLALAVSAIQKIETGVTNGTIKVDGTEIAVFGLGDAAYKGVTTSVTKDSEELVTSGAVEAVVSVNAEEIKTHKENTEIHVTTDNKANWNDKYTKEETDAKIKAVNDVLVEHAEDGDIHVTSEDKATWNDKYTKNEVDTKIKEHTDKTEIHVTSEDKVVWNDKYTKEEIDGKVNAINITTGGLQTQITTTDNSLKTHTDNSDIHVTVDDKAIWNDKYTKTETDNAIATAIANVDHLKRAIVTELPTTDIDANTIYMIKKGSSDSGDNYEEYMLIDGSLVKIGDTTVDLSDYLTKTGDASDVTVTFTEAEEDKPELTTGDKISVLIGKIKKWFSSLHKVATSGDYNDLNNRIMTYEGTQTTAEFAHTLPISSGEEAVIYSIELYMNGEKVIGDVVVNNATINVKFTAQPESAVTVKALYLVK